MTRGARDPSAGLPEPRIDPGFDAARVACRPETARRDPTVRRLSTIFLIVVAGLIQVTTLRAQFPGELAGRITDAITGGPVDHVRVEVLGFGRGVSSDGDGRFRVRGLEPGRHSVRFSRLGYEPLTLEVEIANGSTEWLDVSLGPNPVDVEGVRATGEERIDRSLTIDREEIEASGAATVAELLEGLPGVVLRGHGPTGPQTISIRGSSASEVLVLLDGSPVAGPLTGEADLSSIPTSQVESIEVLPGSQSARYGPGALAGVVLIRSRSSSGPLGARLETGSLGSWSGSAETGGVWRDLHWSLGGQGRSVDGEFRFERPESLGGGSATRVNSDLQEASVFGAVAADAGGGTLRLRGGYAALERGIPGPSFTPTPGARGSMDRWHWHAGWERAVGAGRLDAALYGLDQTIAFRDPAPPVGPPYESETSALTLGGRLDGELSLGGLLESLTGGLEIRHQRYESAALDVTAPAGRTDLGAFVATRLIPGSRLPSLSLALRLDRDGLADRWWLTHELALTQALGPAAIRLRHASGYSPPTVGDQFFKAGVAVEPNPDLRAERVPSETGLGATLEGRLGAGTRGRLSVDLYAADVEGLILWAPDFRFVWSPRNFDVDRRGLDMEAALDVPRHELRLEASYSLMRATYGGRRNDDVQIMYRPRHTARLSAGWQPGMWDLGLEGRYTGKRYPVPARVNALDPFWALDLRLGLRAAAGGWLINPAVFVDRLLDNESSLIFGYPEPGRTVRLRVTLRRR